MILHSDQEGNDCIWKLRCHCIQILHPDIYSFFLFFSKLVIKLYLISDLMKNLRRFFFERSECSGVIKVLHGVNENDECIEIAILHFKLGKLWHVGVKLVILHAINSFSHKPAKTDS